MATPATASVLDQYATPTEVAHVFGISRQAVHAMMRKGDFKKLYVLPTVDESDRPQFLVSRKEMLRIAAERSGETPAE